MTAVAKTSDPAYLVRVDDMRYLFEMTPDGVTGTTILSAAAHFPYFEADQMCQSLRKSGHIVAVVCNVYGDPVDVSEVRNAKLTADEDVESPATGLSAVDWALVGAASSAEEPTEIAKRLGISIGDLAARMSAASEKFERVITAMRSSSHESADLTELNRQEFEERRQNNRR